MGRKRQMGERTQLELYLYLFQRGREEEEGREERGEGGGERKGRRFVRGREVGRYLEQIHQILSPSMPSVTQPLFFFGLRLTSAPRSFGRKCSVPKD